MRRTIYLFIGLCVSSLGITQTGFIQSYDFDHGGIGFYNMVLNEDTLILFGSTQHPTSSQWGLYFAKIDTSGNLLNDRIHYDNQGDSYVFDRNSQVIKTSDGGYGVVGQTFQRGEAVFFKLNSNGALEFISEYSDSNALTLRYQNIVETPNGFISAGVKQQPDDGYWDTFIIGADNQGNILWEITYGEYGVYDRLTGISKTHENEYLITGSTFISSEQVTNLSNMWSMSKAIKVDTMGEITWEWQGEIEYIGGSSPDLRQLYPTNDGNWVNEGSTSTLLDNNTLVHQGEIVKRDTDFNIIWSTSFGEPTSNENNFVDITSTPDEGWVAVGQYVNRIDDDPLGGYRASIIAKVNADGDSLWSRIDTLFDHTTIVSRPFLSDVLVLPSGSIFACGYVNKLSPPPSKSYGWLIKVDAYGCIEPGCNPIVSTENLTPLLEDFSIFPNPVSQNVTVKGTDIFYIQLLNSTGQILQDKNVYEIANIDMQKYPKGSYLIRIKRGNTWLVKKIIKS